MKLKPTIITCVLLCFLLFTCSEKDTEHIDNDYGTNSVLEIDSCEYVVWNFGYAGGIVHKQNCKFCISRGSK